MIHSYSAGGDIDAWCPRCNLKSGHTIIAIVDNLPKKFKCSICDEHHNFNAKQSGKSRTGSKSTIRKKRSKEAAYENYLSRLIGGDPANSIKYTVKGNFEKDQVINHLKFDCL